VGLRARIDREIVDGKSDSAIKAALIQQYGHGIMIEPEGIRGIAAYTGPILAFLIGLWTTLRWIRNRARTARGSDVGLGPPAGELPDLEFDS
ncbi:MAG: cytochrome c-type biogenesis protein CcmH, partial [Bryobacteraceae bacterium]